MFQHFEYRICKNADLEVNYEKVALYAKHNQPKHAARQLEDGRWTSKIGSNVDIEHASLRAVEGPLYGTAAMYLKRRRQAR